MKTDLSDIARAADLSPFPRHAVSSVTDVQAAVQAVMNGRTHFYDAGTMAYFSCRVRAARIFCDGIVIGTVCTQAAGFRGGRVYTVNFHDLTGYCLNRRDDEREDYATRDAAKKAFETYAAGLDGEKILGDAIRRERDRATRELRALRGVLRRFGRRLQA